MELSKAKAQIKWERCGLRHVWGVHDQRDNPNPHNTRFKWMNIEGTCVHFAFNRVNRYDPACDHYLGLEYVFGLHPCGYEVFRWPKMAIEWQLTKFQRQSTEHDDEIYRNGPQNWSAGNKHRVRSVDQMSMRDHSRPRAQQINVSSEQCEVELYTFTYIIHIDTTSIRLYVGLMSLVKLLCADDLVRAWFVDIESPHLRFVC